MFEKDETYRKAKSECKAKITRVIKVWNGREETIHAVSFKEGAEFGFKECAKSRLNITTISDCPIKDEWHKQEVDDIWDFIAEDWSAKYFICVMKDKSRVMAIGNCDEGCNGEVGVNLFFEHDDEKYYIDDIVWWKEIVLPKEI